jgi:hypothetical protein
MSACKRVEIEAEPLLAGALGMRWCLQVAKELNLRRVTISADTTNVSNCLNSTICIAAIDSIILHCINDSVRVCQSHSYEETTEHNISWSC